MDGTPVTRWLRPPETGGGERTERAARLGARLLSLEALALVAAGLATILIGATVGLLPYDSAYLGLTMGQLCQVDGCLIVRFVTHDRVAFGGSVAAIGLLYLFLASGPVRRGEAWAWWALLLSGLVGFGAFATFLGTGYLDRVHLGLTIGLALLHTTGMAAAFAGLRSPRGPAALLRPGAAAWFWSRAGRGRALLMLTGLGLTVAGATIMVVGVTAVFVPQDLAYMNLDASFLRRLSDRLVPVIAHDRAEFGGGICATGIAWLALAWCGIAPGVRRAWLALVAAGVVGFVPTIAVHFLVGYTSFVHLAPAYAGVLLLLGGAWLLWAPVWRPAAPGRRFPDR
jgi:hypothetical protein